MWRSVGSLEEALERIDAVNETDPRMDASGDAGPEGTPKELLYGRRMTTWLAKLAPDASEALQIACRGQHIARWRWPRSDYPDGRVGYKAWRRELYGLHAHAVTAILEQMGSSDELMSRVASLIGKKDRTSDSESQTLEDVACMVFLEFEFAAFAAKHENDKVIRVVRKTWHKMSEPARAAALQLTLPEDLGGLVKKAIL